MLGILFCVLNAHSHQLTLCQIYIIKTCKTNELFTALCYNTVFKTETYFNYFPSITASRTERVGDELVLGCLSCRDMANCAHVEPKPEREVVSAGPFKGILACIYANFGEKHGKLRTAPSTSATEY